MAVTVNRKPLTFWERLYMPAIIGGLKVTLKHAYSTLIQGKVVTMEYPEQKWTLPANYRGAPYLVKDQEGSTKCVSCQLCEFVCPPKAIRITPPGPNGQPADRAKRKAAVIIGTSTTFTSGPAAMLQSIAPGRCGGET